MFKSPLLLRLFRSSIRKDVLGSDVEQSSGGDDDKFFDSETIAFAGVELDRTTFDLIGIAGGADAGGIEIDVGGGGRERGGGGVKEFSCKRNASSKKSFGFFLLIFFFAMSRIEETPKTDIDNRLFIPIEQWFNKEPTLAIDWVMISGVVFTGGKVYYPDGTENPAIANLSFLDYVQQYRDKSGIAQQE